MSRFLFLWRFISDQKLKLVFAIFSLAFISAASLVYPWLLKIMVDQIEEKNISGMSIQSLSIILIIVIFAASILGHFSYILLQDLGFRLRNNLRIAYFDFLLNRPMSFYKDRQVGELTARAGEDIGKIQPIFNGLISTICQNVLFICGCLVLMIMLNPIATILVLILMLIPMPFIILFSRKMRKLSSSSQAFQDTANGIIEESLIGIREIKSFIMEKFKLSHYKKVLDKGTEKEVKSSRLHSRISQTFYFIISVMLIAIFYKGSLISGSSGWSIGGAIAFYFYAYTLATAFLAMGRGYMSYQTIAGAADRIREFLIEYKPDEIIADSIPSISLTGKIEFNKISFSYEENKPVFNDLSFKVDAGSWFLITGNSGSGKSTIAGLILGFYKAQTGELLLDDISIDKIDDVSLRKNIGYVGQDPILFQGTVLENILMSRNFSDSQVLDVLKICCLDKFIAELPNGIDTIIGERGITLSGGQRSRIAIARAIISSPPILILDEAGAQLEKELESELWNNILIKRKNKTTMILSHHIENIPPVYKHMELG